MLLIVGWRCGVTLSNVYCGRRMTSHSRFWFLHTFIVDEAKQEGENDYAKCHPGNYDPGIVKPAPATCLFTRPRSTAIEVTVFINIAYGKVDCVRVNCTSNRRCQRENEVWGISMCTNIFINMPCSGIIITQNIKYIYKIKYELYSIGSLTTVWSSDA